MAPSSRRPPAGAATPRAVTLARSARVKFSTPDGIEVPKILSIYRLEGDKLIVRRQLAASSGPVVQAPAARPSGPTGMVFTGYASTKAATVNAFFLAVIQSS